MSVTFVGFRFRSELVPGEPVELEYTLINTGSEPASYTFPISVEGVETPETITVETEPGFTYTGELTVQFEKTGVYTVQLDNKRQTVIVGDVDAMYTVENVTTNSHTYTEGDDVSVSITVQNKTDDSFSADLPVMYKKENADTVSISLRPNEKKVVKTKLTADTVGEHVISAAKEQTTITVNSVPENIVQRTVNTDEKTVELSVVAGATSERFSIVEAFDPYLESIDIVDVTISNEADEVLTIHHEGGIILCYENVVQGTQFKLVYEYEKVADEQEHQITSNVSTSSRSETAAFGPDVL